MIRILLLFTLLLCAGLSHASHIVGGEMYYDCLGNGQYRITVKVYRDCFSTGAQFDSPLPVSIFTGNNQFVRTENFTFPGSVTIPVTFNNPCVTPPNNICVQEAIYTKVISLPASANGYILAYQRCCRGPNVQNLWNPDEAGLTLTSRIPPSTVADCNSSPRFSNYPPMMLCNNEPLVFNHSATDPDGDQLVYELCAPFDGGTSLAPAPNPASNPPYALVQWAPGFSAANPLGPGASIQIDPNTGLLTASPNLAGLYAVGICVKEYRNGVLLSQTTRDFLFRVINCQIQLVANITPQVELPGFVNFCQGLTVQFQNSSFNGSSFFWDFGVPGVTSDTSSAFAPSFTFPAPGEYEVTLIANPGWPCTDTSVQTFIVNNPIDISFIPPAPQCILGNNFSFSSTGTFDLTQDEVTWNFGSFANPATSNALNPSGVVFDTNGYIPIQLSVSNDYCLFTYTDSILVYGVPTVDFFIDTMLMCAPFTAYFQDLSFANAPISYLWNFGDGTTSTEQNPVHLYPVPGVYDVTLSIVVEEGCTANITVTQPGAIDVKPSPVAAFTVDPPIAEAFTPFITFSDQSQGGISHWYFFTPGDSLQARDTVFSYQTGGYHYPMQVVTNEYGCTDTAVRTVYIIPYSTLYVPNSFTPNGDGINEVFLPLARDMKLYKFEIFTRWGNRIFTTEDQYEGWDGTINGKPAADGVYIYQIHYRKAHDGLDDLVRGHFTLMR